MSGLSPKITYARDRALARLSELHDDYFHTNQVWVWLLREQLRGTSFTANNAKTGAVTANQSEWLSRARTSQKRLRERTFKDISNEFELFLNDLLTVWLGQFPESVFAKSITLATLLGATDLDSAKKLAIKEAVDATVMKILLGKPKGWFSYLRANLGCNSPASTVDSFVERKAARDILEHHNGEVDDSYLGKAGDGAIFKLGEEIVTDDLAIDRLYELIKNLITQVADDACVKSSTTADTLNE